jgi:hypothetical protein
MGIRLPGLGRSKLLHRTEHFAQWRRCHVVNCRIRRRAASAL